MLSTKLKKGPSSHDQTTNNANTCTIPSKKDNEVVTAIRLPQDRSWDGSGVREKCDDAETIANHRDLASIPA